MKKVFITLGALLPSMQAMAFDIAPKGSGHGFNLESFLPLIIILAALYFIMIRPQMRKNKEHRQLLQNLSKDDEVVTAGGILGQVEKVDDHFVDLQVAKGTTIRVQKQSVSNVVPKGSVNLSATSTATKPKKTKS